MVELVEGTGGAARRRSPLENFWTLGVALAAGVTIAVAAVVVCGGSMRPTRVSLMSDEQRLKMDNFLAKHAVDQFSTSGQEGFQDMGSFHRASAGVGIDVAKESAEHEKFSVLKFKQNRNALDDDNRRSKSNLDLIAALDENDEKNREHDILHRLKARRQSLQDNLDYENKMNGVLSEASDREGENLLRQVKRATKYADGIADSEAKQTAQHFRNQLNNIETSQSAVAAQIAGLPDPNAHESEEAQNLLLANAKAAQCIASGRYRTGDC